MGKKKSSPRAKRDPKVVSKTMARIKRKNTKPERALRRALWSAGYRYRVDPASVEGRPDIVFPRKKIAVFVDGDFWHGNQWRLRKKKSLREHLDGINNQSYWIEKIERNIARARAVNRLLRSRGYLVIRLWESEIEKNLRGAIDKIEKAYKSRPL